MYVEDSRAKGPHAGRPSEESKGVRQPLSVILVFFLVVIPCSSFSGVDHFGNGKNGTWISRQRDTEFLADILKGLVLSCGGKRMADLWVQGQPGNSDATDAMNSKVVGHGLLVIGALNFFFSGSCTQMLMKNVSNLPYIMGPCL